MNFAQWTVDQVCPSHRFLDEMTSVIPWTLFNEELKRGIVRKTGGRPPYPLLLLFRMHLLQVWFALSDAQCEFQCRDRLSFRRFLGVGITDPIPDATTLETFRHDFEPLAEKVFSRLDEFFQTQKLLLKSGSVVDATFIRANSRPHRDAEKNSDLDAEHGHKGFGYSATTNVDVGSKLIRKVVVTSARPHDSQMLAESLKGDETILYADSAYGGHRHQVKGIKTRILYKRRRGKKGEPPVELPPRQKALNKAYAKVRARGEHVFASWKTGLGGIRRAWYRGLSRVTQQCHSLALAYNLRRYGFLCRAQCV
jgi:transposase, IS5 family